MQPGNMLLAYWSSIDNKHAVVLNQTKHERNAMEFVESGQQQYANYVASLEIGDRKSVV